MIFAMLIGGFPGRLRQQPEDQVRQNLTEELSRWAWGELDQERRKFLDLRNSNSPHRTEASTPKRQNSGRPAKFLQANGFAKDGKQHKSRAEFLRPNCKQTLTEKTLIEPK